MCLALPSRVRSHNKEEEETPAVCDDEETRAHVVENAKILKRREWSGVNFCINRWIGVSFCLGAKSVSRFQYFALFSFSIKKLFACVFLNPLTHSWHNSHTLVTPLKQKRKTYSWKCLGRRREETMTVLLTPTLTPKAMCRPRSPSRRITTMILTLLPFAKLFVARQVYRGAQVVLKR